MKPAAGRRVCVAMENRVWIFVVIIMFVACIALAGGWIQMADQAVGETKRCQTKLKRKLADVPRIIVTTTDIVYDRVFVTKVDQFLDNDAPTQQIEELVRRLENDARYPCDPATICLDNIVILEMAQAADMRVVRHIMATAWAAGYDVLYASLRDPRSW